MPKIIMIAWLFNVQVSPCPSRSGEPQQIGTWGTHPTKFWWNFLFIPTSISLNLMNLRLCPYQVFKVSGAPSRCKCQCSHKVKHPAICCYVTTKTVGVDTRVFKVVEVQDKCIKMSKLHINISGKIAKIQFLKVM